MAGVAATTPPWPVIVRVEDLGARTAAGLVSASYFDVLGIETARGRFLLPSETSVPGEGSAAVVSHNFWMGELKGGDLIGSLITVNGIDLTIVGIGPAGFRGHHSELPPVDLWVPITLSEALYPELYAVSGGLFENEDMAWIYPVGRLAEKASIVTAEAELDVLGAALSEGIFGLVGLRTRAMNNRTITSRRTSWPRSSSTAACRLDRSAIPSANAVGRPAVPATSSRTSWFHPSSPPCAMTRIRRASRSCEPYSREMVARRTRRRSRARRRQTKAAGVSMSVPGVRGSAQSRPGCTPTNFGDRSQSASDSASGCERGLARRADGTPSQGADAALASRQRSASTRCAGCSRGRSRGRRAERSRSPRLSPAPPHSRYPSSRSRFLVGI